MFVVLMHCVGFVADQDDTLTLIYQSSSDLAGSNLHDSWSLDVRLYNSGVP